MSNAKWIYYAMDNSGKRQNFTVSAPDKQTAINKGFERAKKYAKGDIVNWECRLVCTF